MPHAIPVIPDYNHLLWEENINIFALGKVLKRMSEAALKSRVCAQHYPWVRSS